MLLFIFIRNPSEHQGIKTKLKTKLCINPISENLDNRFFDFFWGGGCSLLKQFMKTNYEKFMKNL